MTTFLALTALTILIITILPGLRSPVWWIRCLDFPRLQIAFVAGAWLLCAFLIFVTGTPTGLFWPVIVGGCLVYQVWWIYPYTPWHKVEVPWSNQGQNHTELSILTSNVLMNNRDARPLLELVETHRPDVLATLESDSWWESQLNTLELYPHRLSHPLDNKYGMHLYSRLPLLRAEIDCLVEDDVPSMSVEFLINQTVRTTLHILHPRPPAPGENLRSTERDVELLVFARHLRKTNSPVVVSGDLNDVAWSRTTRLFRRMSGLLDIRVGRGMYNTFHAEYPFLRWPLDHVFVSGHFRVVNIQRLPYMGSDHFPVLATLAFQENEEAEPHLELENADKELVQETLNTDVAVNASAPKPLSIPE